MNSPLRSLRCVLRRTLATIAFTGVLASVPAHAETTFDLPAQPLADSLRAVADKTGSNILFDHKLVDGRRATPLQADLTLEQALEQLLAGTGLTYRVSDTRTIIIVAEQSGEVTNAPNFAQQPSNRKPSAKVFEHAAIATSNIDEVVVTASKRSEALGSISAAVTAIPGAQLEGTGAREFQDYFRDVPGLMLEVDGQGHFDFSLRGTTSYIAGIPSTSATVAQYVDEIPVTASQAQIDMRLVDVERIEVLRGPQGTLYGQGALGGAIRIITRKPDLDNFSASVAGQLSSTVQGGINNEQSAMLNLPLIDKKLAMRVGYIDASDSGYIDLAKTGADSQIVTTFKKDANDSRTRGGRVLALFAPSDAVSVLAEAITTQTRADALDTYQLNVGDLVAAVPCATAEIIGASQCYYRAQDERADLYNLTVSADLGWGSFISSSSRAKTERRQVNVPVQAEVAVLVPDDLTFRDAFTQELRLMSSPGWSDDWDYALGAYFSRNRSSNSGQASIGSNPIPIYEDNRETAIFGEAGYKFASSWSARLGVRASEIRQAQRAGRLIGELPLPGESGADFEMVEHSRAYYPVTGRAMLNYSWNDRVNLYASISDGFREGGINIPAVDRDSNIPWFYAPDRATNYEMGWKLSVPERNAFLNGALFHIDWRDVQTVLLTDAAPRVNYFGNGGDVRVNGLEVEGAYELLNGLQLRGSFALLDARLADDYVFSTSPEVLHGSEGDRMPFVARVSGGLSVSYRRSLGAGARYGFMTASTQYQGARTTDYRQQAFEDRSPTYAVMDPYWTTQAQLGIESGQLRIALYADNLLNERAELARFHTLTGTTQVSNRPRTVGLSLRYSFE
jgi:iron complex outermembrane receptor protein